MTSSPLLAERFGAVELWTLNLPDRRNVLTDESLIVGLEAAVARANADPALGCIVITGAGSTFSAGGDLKELAQTAADASITGYQISQQHHRGIQRLARAIDSCELPVVAAVNGPAVGAGCDLAVMCDLRIASSKAFFAASFVKLGLVPGDGGVWFLARAVGAARAAQMVFTGERIDAETALGWGLVSEVVEPDRLPDAALDLAQRIGSSPSPALRMSKQLLRSAGSVDLQHVLSFSAAAQALAQGTPQHREAIDAIGRQR